MSTNELQLEENIEIVDFLAEEFIPEDEFGMKLFDSLEDGLYNIPQTHGPEEAIEELGEKREVNFNEVS